MMTENTICKSCNGDVEETRECDFCSTYKCPDCIKTENFIDTGWICCDTCFDLILVYSDNEDLELTYENTEMFKLEITELTKAKSEGGK